MRKRVFLFLVMLFICSTCYAYDLETLVQAKNRYVDITMKDGSKIDGIVWDVVKIVEDDSGSAKVVKYSVSGQDFSRIRISGDELKSNTRTKYYLIIRKGVVEYTLDSDNIALLGVQKW